MEFKPVYRYRANVVFTAKEFDGPRTFKVELYAESESQAYGKSLKWLEMQPLTELFIRRATIQYVKMKGDVE